jgi:hypothetical protein
MAFQGETQKDQRQAASDSLGPEIALRERKEVAQRRHTRHETMGRTRGTRVMYR